MVSAIVGLAYSATHSKAFTMSTPNLCPNIAFADERTLDRTEESDDHFYQSDFRPGEADEQRDVLDEGVEPSDACSP